MLLLILKSSACLAIFMLFYKLCLEKTSAHIFKRFYLIGVILISISIPFITFTEYIEIEPVNFNSSFELINGPIVYSTEIVEPKNYLPIFLWSIYLIGALLFSFRFFKNLYKLVQKIRLNPKYKNQNFINVLLNDLVTPHTFFKYIFLNKTNYENSQIPQEVLLHEQAHAKQIHALDILFIEILQILFWFNPLFYFIKKDIKLNHEFLADQAVINKGTNTKYYQELLLAYSSNASPSPLANAINYSLIKKRFTVMKTKTSKTAFWIRSLILLPLLVILIFSFSDKKAVRTELEKTNNSIVFPENSQNETLINDVYILINSENKILLNDKLTYLDNLLNDINKLNPNLTIDQKRKFLQGNIMHQTSTSKDLIKKIQDLLFEANIWAHATTNLEVVKKNGLKISTPKLPLMNSKNLSEEDKILYQHQLNKYKEWLRINKPNRQLIETEKGYIIKNENGKVSISTDPTIEAEPFKLKKDSPWKITTGISETTYNSSKNDEITKQTLIVDQQKATPEQITEYNTLAKKYNSQPQSKRVVKLKDVKRLEYLYSLMSKQQKTNSQPFPDCPPPPPAPPAPPIVKKGDISNIPPPPLPANASAADKAAYKKVIYEYEKKNKRKVHQMKTEDEKLLNIVADDDVYEVPQPPDAPIVKKGEVSDIPTPPSPPEPQSPLDHVIEMAKKGATFYYNDKKISSDKAIDLLKNNEDLNISSKKKDGVYVVKIQTEPIRF